MSLCKIASRVKMNINCLDDLCCVLLKPLFRIQFQFLKADYEKFLKSQSETKRDTGGSSYHMSGRSAIWDRDPIRRRVEVLSRAAQALVSRYRTRDPLQDLCVMSRREI